MLIKLTKNGWLIVFILCAIPVLFWLNIKSPADRFYSKYETFTSLGQLSSLVGSSLFAISLILSSRLKIIEKFIAGMNRAYINHHLIGGMSFILLMLHPMFLTIPYLFISVKAAISFILPKIENWEVYFGIASLLFMMTLLFITFYTKLPYHIWKMTHKFLGVAFFIGIIHAIFVSSDISAYAPLRIYMIILFGTAFVLYLYRSVFWRYFVPRLPYTVASVLDLGNKTVEITLNPIKKHLEYKAGQFVFINFIGKGVSSETHPFSIVSGPKDDSLSITVKELGDYTNLMGKLPIGTKAFVEGPFGAFYKSNAKGNQIWVAGGIGITPFVSMAKDFANTHTAEQKVTLFYSISDKTENQYIDFLSVVQKNNPNFKLIPFYSKEYGRISATEIVKLQSLDPKTELFFCGPPPMMKALREQFRALGVKQKNIHSEEFSID